jgi:hypothetical protein
VTGIGVAAAAAAREREKGQDDDRCEQSASREHGVVRQEGQGGRRRSSEAASTPEDVKQ